MRYILYILTLALVFSAGMMVGNTFLPEHGVSLSTAVSAPDVDGKNPIFSTTDRANAERELALLGDTLQTCPMVVTSDKDIVLNHIKLWMALEDFEIKRAHLETEIVKNNAANRPTMQFVQATSEYNAARAAVEKLAEELFPTTQEILINPALITTLISSYTATAPATALPAAPAEEAVTEPADAAPTAPEAQEPQEPKGEVTAEEKPASKVEEKKAEVTAEEKPAAKAEEKKAEVKTEEKPAAKAEEKKAEVKTEEKTAAKAEEKKAEEKPAAKAEDKKADVPSETPAAPAEQKPAEKSA